MKRTFRIQLDVFNLHVFLVIISPAGAVAKYCDECVCLCVCLSVCPTRYLRNYTRDIYQIFCACCPCLRLGRAPASWR